MLLLQKPRDLMHLPHYYQFLFLIYSIKKSLRNGFFLFLLPQRSGETQSLVTCLLWHAQWGTLSTNRTLAIIEAVWMFGESDQTESDRPGQTGAKCPAWSGLLRFGPVSDDSDHSPERSELNRKIGSVRCDERITSTAFSNQFSAKLEVRRSRLLQGHRLELIAFYLF